MTNFRIVTAVAALFGAIAMGVGALSLRTNAAQGAEQTVLTGDESQKEQTKTDKQSLQGGWKRLRRSVMVKKLPTRFYRNGRWSLPATSLRKWRRTRPSTRFLSHSGQKRPTELTSEVASEQTLLTYARRKP
jgi:hypothetical protein